MEPITTTLAGAVFSQLQASLFIGAMIGEQNDNRTDALLYNTVSYLHERLQIAPESPVNNALQKAVRRSMLKAALKATAQQERNDDQFRAYAIKDYLSSELKALYKGPVRFPEQAVYPHLKQVFAIKKWPCEMLATSYAVHLLESFVMEFKHSGVPGKRTFQDIVSNEWRDGNRSVNWYILVTTFFAEELKADPQLAAFWEGHRAVLPAVHWPENTADDEASAQQQADELIDFGDLQEDGEAPNEMERAFLEALQFRSDVAQGNSVIYLPGIAQIFYSLGHVYSDRDHAQAAQYYGESLVLRRILAETDTSTYLPQVAVTLKHLAIQAAQTNIEVITRVLKPYQESLRLFRNLAEVDPAAYLPEVAAILHELGVWYHEGMAYTSAAQHYEEALQLYRDLREVDAAAYLPELATTLHKLSGLYRETGDNAQAIQYNEEALAIRRGLAETAPATYLPDVAKTGSDLAVLYGERQTYPQAEQCYQESLAIFRELARVSPMTYLPHLAKTLHNLGDVYRESEADDQAAQCYEASQEVLRDLAEVTPEPDLSIELANDKAEEPTLSEQGGVAGYNSDLAPEGSYIAPEMVAIPGGTFEMGDVMEDTPLEVIHTVRVSPFQIGKYAVTFAEYDAFCRATNRELFDDHGWGRGRRPLSGVSWYKAVEYCNWLSEQEGLKPVYRIDKLQEDPNNTNDFDGTKWLVTPDWSVNGYRLPTEAEWEYAARGCGQWVRFGNGKDIADPEEINFDGEEKFKEPYSKAGLNREKTVEVGSLNSPNSLGLHDMSGNVLEWCWDWYYRDYYQESPLNNPRGPVGGSDRVLRGSSYNSFPPYCRIAHRHARDSSDWFQDIGFRLARG